MHIYSKWSNCYGESYNFLNQYLADVLLRREKMQRSAKSMQDTIDRFVLVNGYVTLMHLFFP